MEYTFKNSVSAKAQTIILNHHGLTIQSGAREETISYASVTAVTLAKRSKNGFCIQIHSSARKPLNVTNKYYLPGGEFEDRSRQYAAFVRILHLHLKNKGGSVFMTGNNMKTLTIWVLLSAFVAFFISFISEFFNVSIVNPFIQALVITAILLVSILLMYRGKFPKEYSPGDIPLQFLP